MKKLINLPLNVNLGVPCSYKQSIKQMINARRLALMQSSGHPVATQVVGKIQQSLKLNSMDSLLESILKLRNIAIVASEILDTIPILKVDRYQLETAEIMTYINSITGTSGYYKFSDADRSLIAFMITSSESAESGWVLDVYESNNMFLALQRLYESLADVTPQSTGTDITGLDMKSSAIYDPAADSITVFKESKRVIKALNGMNKSLKDAKTDSQKKRILADHLSVFSNQLTINSISSIRIIDHIWLLLTSQEIWGSFISPRNSADPSQNKERAQSLQLFAAYLHSLLMYNSLFNIEMFMHTYKRLSDWVSTFPPLPNELVEQYAMIITKHDYLGASMDIASLIGRCDQAKGSFDNDSNLTAFPIESISLFGLDKTLELIRSTIEPKIATVSLTDLSDLTTNDFAHVLLSQPVAEYDMIYPLTEVLLRGNIVRVRIEEAISGLVNGIPRYYSALNVDGRLRKLSIHPPFSLGIHQAHNFSLSQAQDVILRGGNWGYRPFIPVDSWDWKRYVRKEKNMSLLTARTAAKDFVPPFFINADHTDQLRRILQIEWRGYYPSWLMNGNTYISHSQLKSDDILVREVFENISGQSFEWIVRTIINPYVKTKWATALSSWATLYIVDPENKNFDDVIANPVDGYGSPYGVSYSALRASQDPGKSLDDLIKISDQAYIKIHNRIPTPSSDLKFDDDFFLNHPYYYYAGNSTKDVTKWVINESMYNFSCIPSLHPEDPSLAFIDKRYAYMNDAIYLQSNALFTPSKNDLTIAAIPMTKKTWDRARYKQWLELIVPGNYGISSGSSIKGSDLADEAIQMVRDMEQTIQQIEEAAPINNLERAGGEVIKDNQIDIEVKQKDKEKASAGGKKRKKGAKNPDEGKIDADDSESKDETKESNS